MLAVCISALFVIRLFTLQPTTFKLLPITYQLPPKYYHIGHSKHRFSVRVMYFQDMRLRWQLSEL